MWAIVARIPAGKVATYKQIAVMLGNPFAARIVGWAMNGIPDNMDLPWHRVINSKGRVSSRNREHEAEIQQRLLTAEGIEFDMNGTIDLERFQWQT